ncbi:hypothetical protein KSS87_019047 [Heliosperma pusillum]|nr:hypothetical protein KSS87_019047 [Heliosperma pusillum]
MASNKISIAALLLVFGVVLMVGVGNVKEAEAQKICPQFCENNVAYVTCVSSGATHLTTLCTNCCKAGPGCTLHFKDGTTKTC